MDSKTVKCFAKYANDASGLIQSSLKNNSRITLDENGKVCIVANKRIAVSAEIFCGYGTGYWKNLRLSVPDNGRANNR